MHTKTLNISFPPHQGSCRENHDDDAGLHPCFFLPDPAVVKGYRTNMIGRSVETLEERLHGDDSQQTSPGLLLQITLCGLRGYLLFERLVISLGGNAGCGKFIQLFAASTKRIDDTEMQAELCRD